MSNLTQFFSGGGVKPFKNYRVLTSSGSFTTSARGKLYVLACGAGGSGAVNRLSTGSATGGGAGEIAFDVIDITPGTTFTCTIGAGGSGNVASSGIVFQAGNDGGNTIISGTNGYALTVNGGKGGKIPTSGASTGGDGGSGGTGGSSNVRFYSGGGGGPVTNASSSSATGGGAVNFLGLSQSSVTAGSNATGGAGIGGTSVGQNSGGSGGPATGGAGGPAFILSGQSFLQQESFWKLPVFGAGVTTGAGGDGAGGAAGSGGSGGFFGGGGAVSTTNSGGYTSGYGGIGAGGGGGYVTQGTVTSGYGGNGIVVFIEVEEF